MSTPGDAGGIGCYKITHEFRYSKSEWLLDLVCLTFLLGSSIITLTSSGCDAVVAYLLPKQTVEGSSPFTRSTSVSGVPLVIWPFEILVSREGFRVYDPHGSSCSMFLFGQTRL